MYMVNNQSKRAYYLRPFLLFYFFITVCSITNAQKISKYYTSSMQENGVLYFIEPEQEFKNKLERSKFSYDMTYLTTKDSIFLNFTYSDNTIIVIDSISFVQGNKRISSNTEKLFIEADKEIWKHRYSAKFLFNDINSIFQQGKKPIVLIYYESEIMQLEIRNSKWRKQSEIMSKILTMIKANMKST